MPLMMSDEPVQRYGAFGGFFMPESVVEPLKELKRAFIQCKTDTVFLDAYRDLLTSYAGRPTALTPAKRLQAAVGGPPVYLKREDLLHTGAHKMNNALGQCLLAKHMGKTRIIAETGAGQHGVATATVCAKLGLSCVIYMGEKDMQRQAVNVKKMTLLGACVEAVCVGERTLKEAVNAALREYAASFETTHYCLGSALGPDPYPEMVAFFQSVIGEETRAQVMQTIGALPSVLMACVGGGSNALGLFSAFIDSPAVQCIGIEAGGQSMQLGQHAARFKGGRPGVLHGCYSYVLQDQAGQMVKTHAISAGLDYPMVSPQHAHFYETGRVRYEAVTDQQALHAFRCLSETEGILPALESAHAVAYYIAHAHELKAHKDTVVINLSGRGDKDMDTFMALEKKK